MIRTVMLPVDLSRDASLMVRFCTGLVDFGVRRVIACHVVDTTGLEGPVIAAKVDDERARMRTFVTPLVEAGFDVEVRLPTGDPESELLALAHEGHIDAIVCSTSAKSPADRLFVGSVSERLVRDSGIPSLTVRETLLHNTDDPATLARRFLRMLLVPTDFSATAARALVAAFDLPPRVVGTIRLIHVVPAEANDVKAKQNEQGAAFALRNMTGIFKEKGLSATPVVGHGAPEKAILAEIDESGITGVIVGSRGRNPLQQALLGSVSMTLMRQAGCPVMIVP
jgi:nucleotide-binding universal stress UspA family protein